VNIIAYALAAFLCRGVITRDISPDVDKHSMVDQVLFTLSANHF